MRVAFLILICIVLASCEKEHQKSRVTSKEITSPKPLIDFGDSTYRGYKGGLYPDGSNQRPGGHTADGLAIAKSILPLNATGQSDVINGKIVWLSIGMSNTTQETQAFLDLASTFPEKNPQLLLIDGAVGGQDINIITDPHASYWNTVNSRLSSENASPEQVQVIWFLEAEKVPQDTSFATYPNAS